MMGKEEESEGQSLEEATGLSSLESQEKCDVKSDDDELEFEEAQSCEFLKCAPKVDGYYVEMLSTKEALEGGLCKSDDGKNKHKVLKRIIQNNAELVPEEYSSQASGILSENHCESVKTCCNYDGDELGNNQLHTYEDVDGSWRLRWNIVLPENEDDFIALCWAGQWHLTFHFNHSEPVTVTSSFHVLTATLIGFVHVQIM